MLKTIIPITKENPMNIFANCENTKCVKTPEIPIKYLIRFYSVMLNTDKY